MKKSFIPAISSFPFRLSTIRFVHINYLLLLLLLPATIRCIDIYGLFTARIMATALFSCIFSDALLTKLFRKTAGVHDGSEIVTGLLLSMMFHPLAPWWIVGIASAAAMFLGKHIFGGAGQSPFNAVCLGWAIVTLSWPEIMNPAYGSVGLALPFGIEHPLSELRLHGTDVLETFTTMSLFTGKQAGCIGATSVLPLIVGGCTGIVIGIIPWQLPVSFSAGIALTSLIVSRAGIPAAATPQFHLLTGFSILGIFFLAADLSSRPVSKMVMTYFGITAGVLTVLFRVWSNYPDGLPFAILLLNATIPLLDRGRTVMTKTITPEIERL